MVIPLYKVYNFFFDNNYLANNVFALDSAVVLKCCISVVEKQMSRFISLSYTMS